MSTSEERKIGFRRGIRAAVTWLHTFGKGMNDPHAKVVLDLAADRLGNSKLQEIADDSPNPTRQALEECVRAMEFMESTLLFCSERIASDSVALNAVAKAFAATRGETPKMAEARKQQEIVDRYAFNAIDDSRERATKALATARNALEAKS